MMPGIFGSLANAREILAWFQDVASWRGCAAGSDLALLCFGEADTLLKKMEDSGVLVRGTILPSRQQLATGSAGIAKVTKEDAPRSWFMWLPGPRLSEHIEALRAEISRRENLPVPPAWRSL